MNMDKLKSIIAKVNNHEAILTDIELSNGMLFQFGSSEVTAYMGSAVMKAWCSSPTLKLEKDVWGHDYLTIGYDCLTIKPYEIESIDIDETTN